MIDKLESVWQPYDEQAVKQSTESSEREEISIQEIIDRATAEVDSWPEWARSDENRRVREQIKSIVAQLCS